jgi:hypothetical protein
MAAEPNAATQAASIQSKIRSSNRVIPNLLFEGDMPTRAVDNLA